MRNGISCSTGSELALAIVRSSYRLLAAKADNAASRSGKTLAFIDGAGRRRSLLAGRALLQLAWSGTSAWAEALHLDHGTPQQLRAAPNKLLTALSPWFSASPRWALPASLDTAPPLWSACSRNSCQGEGRNFFLCSSASHRPALCSAFVLLLGLEGCPGSVAQSSAKQQETRLVWGSRKPWYRKHLQLELSGKAAVFAAGSHAPGDYPD